MNRRAFLRRTGAVGTLGALGGCGSKDGRPTSTTRRTSAVGDGSEDRAERPSLRALGLQDRFERLVDLGADGGPAAALDRAIETASGDDTLVVLPAGRHRIPGPVTVLQFANLGIVGHPAGTTLVPPEGYANALFVLGDGARASGLLVEGFAVDIGASGTGPRVLHVRVRDDLLVRNVTTTGQQDVDRVQGMTRFDVTDPGGVGRIERLRLPDGATVGTRSTGCLVSRETRGELTFENCHVAGFPDNGLYASGSHGPVRVLGGTYANNAISNVRVGDGGVVRNVTVRCDRSPDGFRNMRGIWLREGASTLVENCRVTFADVTGSDGGIVATAAATIRDTRVRIDTDGVPALLADAVTHQSEAGGGNRGPSLRVENVAIDGDAADATAIKVVDRDGCRLRSLRVTQPGRNRHGLTFARSRGNDVRDARIAVTGVPFVLQNATVNRTDVTTSAPVADG